MSDETLIIVIAIIIALHFIIGFAWVFRKIYGKSPSETKQKESGNQEST